MSAFACVSIGFRFGRTALTAARIKALAAAGAGPVLLLIGSFPVFKTPAVVSGFEDMAVMHQTVEQGRCHLGIHCPASVCMQTLRGTKHIGPFTEAEIGGDDDAGSIFRFCSKHQLECRRRLAMTAVGGITRSFTSSVPF